MSSRVPSRLACVHVPALPLQVLVRQHPDWRDHPIAVVDEDKPQGVVLWINERARRHRILPGMRYAAALALSSRLRAGAVEATAVTDEVEHLVAELRAFSPTIEPCADEPGVVWLDASGLDGLFPDLESWARGVGRTLYVRGLRSVAVVVGFDRFCTYALAHTRLDVCVLSNPAEERAAADRVPLQRLRLEPRLRDTMLRLGVADVGGFRRLAPAELASRFAAPAAAAQRDAAGTTTTPLAPRIAREPTYARCDFEPGTHGLDQNALLLLVKQQLGALLPTLAARGHGVRALRLRLLVEKRPPLELNAQPAVATLDEIQLVELLQLRLAATLATVTAAADLEGFELHLDEAPTAHEQLQLFATSRHRDLAAGARALARLRAAFGDDTVVTAQLANGHLPEAQFRWQPCTTLREAQPRPALVPRLVRRVLAQPQPLRHQHAGDDGWFVGRLNFGPVQNMLGPHVIAGGWWRRELHREYYFAQTRRGDLVWIFHDRIRRRWCTHGGIE
ncbi:MAG: DNA polymerase Y family protein [Planctomycetota bacterium]